MQMKNIITIVIFIIFLAIVPAISYGKTLIMTGKCSYFGDKPGAKFSHTYLIVPQRDHPDMPTQNTANAPYYFTNSDGFPIRYFEAYVVETTTGFETKIDYREFDKFLKQYYPYDISFNVETGTMTLLTISEYVKGPIVLEVGNRKFALWPTDSSQLFPNTETKLLPAIQTRYFNDKIASSNVDPIYITCRDSDIGKSFKRCFPKSQGCLYDDSGRIWPVEECIYYRIGCEYTKVIENGKCQNSIKRCVITTALRTYKKLAHGDITDTAYDYNTKGCVDKQCVILNGKAKCGFSVASGSMWSTIPENRRCPPYKIGGKPNPACFYNSLKQR